MLLDPSTEPPPLSLESAFHDDLFGTRLRDLEKIVLSEPKRIV